jgi:K+-sensing histidine kinase KdpD
LGNAIKFTDRGKIALQGKEVEEANNQVQLRFEVRDTEVGLSPEFQSNIFDSFSQADETTVRRYAGAGQGLAIPEQLVEVTGGETSASRAHLGSVQPSALSYPVEKQDSAAMCTPILYERDCVVTREGANNSLLMQSACSNKEERSSDPSLRAMSSWQQVIG